MEQPLLVAATLLPHEAQEFIHEPPGATVEQNFGLGRKAYKLIPIGNEVAMQRVDISGVRWEIVRHARERFEML